MFEKFTEKAIKAIMLAQEEARRLGHNFLGTEQILLGLIAEGTGTAAKVLRSIGINLKDARIEVEKVIGRGSGFVGVEIPFTPRAKRALEFSLQEAQYLRHNYVGTEHLLLGLIKEGKGVAAIVLENLGAVLSILPILVIDALNEKYERSKKPTFENFTKKAIKVILYAQEEAYHFGDNYIGSEQILLGLIREETGIAAEVLKSMSVSLGLVRKEVNVLVKNYSKVVPDRFLFTPSTKEILSIASKEAKELKHSHIDTEHLILGLTHEKNNVAVRILENLNIDISEIRVRVFDKLDHLNLRQTATTTIHKKTYKCTYCSHEMIAMTCPGECEICGSSSLVTLH